MITLFNKYYRVKSKNASRCVTLIVQEYVNNVLSKANQTIGLLRYFNLLFFSYRIESIRKTSSWLGDIMYYENYNLSIYGVNTIQCRTSYNNHWKRCYDGIRNCAFVEKYSKRYLKCLLKVNYNVITAYITRYTSSILHFNINHHVLRQKFFFHVKCNLME